MARKRVSLKDKGPETLGLTEKKGQGLDVLFGGPTASRTRSAPVVNESNITNQPSAEVNNMATENKENLTNSVGNAATAPLPAPESLPVNEADDDLSSITGEGTDELGLPVAMEAPPANLVAANLNTGEFDELGLPVAMDTPPVDLTLPVPPQAPPPITAVDDSDLSGLADDNDLSGLAGEEVAPPSPSPVESVPVSFAPPPPAAISEPIPSTPVESIPVESPVESVPPVSTFTPAPDIPVDRPLPTLPPVTTVTTTYTPPTYGSAPTPVTVSTSVTPPPPPPLIESFGGLVTAAGAVRPENILPPDLQYDRDTALEIVERAKVEKDQMITEQVARYIGRERRQALDEEIVQLYGAVSEELNDNKEDVSFALKTLSEAHDIVLEDIRQFDEALYRVALVKTMLVRKQQLRSWSYSWGLFVFFYAITWLIILVSGFVFTDIINAMIEAVGAGTSEGFKAVTAAWYSALAGGIGGVIGILYSLYWRVAVKQNFDRQYLMYYLVQPIMGFILGAVIFFIITVGFLAFNAANTLTSNTVIALQILLGWIAGFRQRLVYELIDKIVQKIAPEESDKAPASVMPEQ